MAIPTHGPRQGQVFHTLDQMICAALSTNEDKDSARDAAPLCIGDQGVISRGAAVGQIVAVAQYLRTLGVAARDRVAVLATRDLQLPIWVAGIIHAGGVYCPIDIHQPRTRVEYQLRTLAPRLIVAVGDIDEALYNCACDIADDIGASVLSSVSFNLAAAAASLAEPTGTLEPNPEIGANDPCYISFTSGSTGLPKAVVNHHGGVSSHLEWMQSVFGAGDNVRVLQKAPLGFDVGIAELLNPLANGGAIVMPAPQWQPIDVEGLVRYVQEYKVTVLSIVPSLLRAIFEVLDDFAQPLECLSQLEHLLLGGEAVPADIVARCREEIGCRVHGLYGPTEAAMDVAWIEYTTDAALDKGQTLIGWPEPNVSLYLRDSAGKEITQANTPGEICIAGVQVAHGYFGRPDLTEEVFIDSFHPALDGGRMYCTGDIAQWTAFGLPDKGCGHEPHVVLEYLGRIGDQVKIRGNRVELGEIEFVMRQIPGIKDAAVVVDSDEVGQQRLVGFYCAAGGATSQDCAEISADDLKMTIAHKLPSYMVPSRLIPLAAIPLSRNGKCDRAALRRLLEVN